MTPIASSGGFFAMLPPESHNSTPKQKRTYEVISETSCGKNKFYIEAFSPRQAAAINRRILATVKSKIVSIRTATI